MNLSKFQKRTEAAHLKKYGEDVDPGRLIFKCMEELGELAEAWNRPDKFTYQDLKDETADVVLTMIGFAARMDFELEDAIEDKWARVLQKWGVTDE